MIKPAFFFARFFYWFVVSLTLWLLSGCDSARDVETPQARKAAVVVTTPIARHTSRPTIAPTRSPTAITLARRTPQATPAATRQPTALPALADLLQSPLPTPGATFRFSATLTVQIPPVRADLAELFRPRPDIGAALPVQVISATTPSIAPTPDGVARTARVPILMYHYVSIPPSDADIFRRDLSVAPTRFVEHLARLQAEGYTTISLYELLAHLTQGAPLPDQAVLLTFDDGYRDTYEQAFPPLVQYGMKATFFVVSDFMDKQQPEYLTWDMAREMLAAGMSIESHGRNHVSLRGKDQDYLVWQALGSSETIEYELGVRPRFISYPAGEYDPLTIDIFRSANYWAGVTTIQGATHNSEDLFQLRRVRIRGSTTPDELSRLLALDW
jgi:peptidoglycan/xylan/chitin deacetylase (PgdA/CDA1 family)